MSRSAILAGILWMMLPLHTAAVTATDAGTTAATGTLRCGWFDNPSPGNATLSDRAGDWDIAEQGGHQADGEWPVFADAQWVMTNGHHGYGCACMTVDADPSGHEVRSIHAAVAKPLAVCRRDRALHEPAHPADE